MVDKNVRKNNREKIILFSIEYRYPEKMPDDIILDRFAQQILDDASTIGIEDINIVNEGEHMIHCPRCGGKLRKITKDAIAKITGTIEYDTYCDNCEKTIYIEDDSSFEQEGNILIKFE